MNQILEVARSKPTNEIDIIIVMCPYFIFFKVITGKNLCYLEKTNEDKDVVRVNSSAFSRQYVLELFISNRLYVTKINIQNEKQVVGIYDREADGTFRFYWNGIKVILA